MAQNGSTNSTQEQTVRTQLTTFINNLQNTQFQAINDNIVMQNEIGATSAATTYNINYKIQGGQIKIQPTVLNDAMFQFITSASSVKNSSLASFNQTTSANSTDQNFYFVVSNGIDSLRVGCESESSQFYAYYTNQIQNQKLKFLIMMICGLGLLFIGVMLILPIVFSVQRTTNKVLSLFGYIPVNDIQDLAVKCEDFMSEYLGEGKHERESEDSDSQKNEDHGVSISKSHQSHFSHHSPKHNNPPSNAHFTPTVHFSPRNSSKPDGSMINHANLSVHIESEGVEKKPRNLQLSGDGFVEIPTGNESPVVKKVLGFENTSPADGKTPQQANSSALGNSMGQSAIRLLEDPTLVKAINSTETANGLITQVVETKKDQQKAEEAKQQANEALSPQDENEEENELQTDRSKKLLNSNGGNRWAVIIPFLLFTMAFMSYYAIDYSIESSFVGNVITLYQFMQLLSQRPAFLEYVNVFTQEELATGQTVVLASKFF